MVNATNMDHEQKLILLRAEILQICGRKLDSLPSKLKFIRDIEKRLTDAGITDRLHFLNDLLVREG